MSHEAAKSRLQKRLDEISRKLRELRIHHGEFLLQLRGIALPASKVDRERIAQLEAYKAHICSTTRELEEWRRLRDRAASKGLLKQAQFRQQMIVAMENKLHSYEEEIRQLRSIPGSFWAGST